jgi:hypothetical protein
VAKFVFHPEEFWKASQDFPPVGKTALYPDQDPLLKIADAIKANLKEVDEA